MRVLKTATEPWRVQPLLGHDLTCPYPGPSRNFGNRIGADGCYSQRDVRSFKNSDKPCGIRPCRSLDGHHDSMNYAHQQMSHKQLTNPQPICISSNAPSLVLASRQISDGMLPVTNKCSTFRISRFDKFPSSVGMVPFNLL